MAFINRIVPLVGLMVLMGNIALVQSIDMTYCADINTASTASNSSIFQSDGLCREFCLGKFAFAVIKDSECWCSDYAPDQSAQVNVDKCNQKCPGFPADTCGGDGVWGYMTLDMEPSGTTGAGSSTRTSSPDTSTGGTTKGTTTPSPSIATVTAGGTVQTITVTPTVTADPNTGTSSDANSTGTTSSQQGLSTGQAVGVAIGVLGAVAIAVAAGVFFWLRRRRRQQGDGIMEKPGSHRGSSAGMMSTPTTAMASVWDGDNGSGGRRNSRFMPHDPRMDPYATNIYSRSENKSHESINTLQDNHDYSRKVLRTTNPDPPDAE
ncbi:Cell wall integrity and stress response component 4 [Parahypoxylon ruwenzoriense]